MIHPESYPITERSGPRPAGLPTECFYCQGPLGGEHHPECVLRKRTVVVRMVCEYVVVIPEHWSAERFESHRRDTGWCADMALSELGGRPDMNKSDEGLCLCGMAHFTFVREATEDDEARLWVSADRDLANGE